MLLKKTEKDKFTEENLGLVRMCVARFTGKGFDYDDLYSVGCIGLVKAVSGFDESLGNRFSTYAVPVILGELKRLFRDDGAVKISRSIKELSLKLSAQRERFIREKGHEPTVSELAQISDSPLDDVIEAISSTKPLLSLTYSGDDEDEIRDIPVPSHERDMVDIISLRQVLRYLSDDERRLISLRFFKGLTQAQTASVLSTNQVQVSRNEKKVLQKIRGYLME
ncbi:MAG: sigma-70 family RNA polymerase sigma factor [Ruminococcus sp.]|jgi:RNA polymerase sporulation-specific sigma factor|nr:sigma-70 family RNA polymerase sigma factor [Ruminococcus sp.]